MLTIHHLGISQSERVIWLCEELGLPYDLIRYDRTDKMAAPPEYKALHPLATAPVITDDDVTLGESGAILEYIARHHGDDRLILGPDHPDFAAYLFWFHYGNGSMVPAFMMDLLAMRYGQAKPSARTENGFAIVEKRLGEAPWFAGEEFTMADIMMVFPLTRGRSFWGRDISGLPKLLAYLQRIGERPAYRIAMEKAEPGVPLPLT